MTYARKKKKYNFSMCTLFWGHPPENVYIFELPRLDFLQFQHDFHSLSDNWEGGGGEGGGGEGGKGVWPFQHIC